MIEACPQMAVYKADTDHPIGNVLPDRYLRCTRRVNEGVQNSKKAYLEHLEHWLKSKPSYSPDELIVVDLQRTHWDTETRSLPPSFRRSFD